MRDLDMAPSRRCWPVAVRLQAKDPIWVHLPIVAEPAARIAAEMSWFVEVPTLLNAQFERPYPPPSLTPI